MIRRVDRNCKKYVKNNNATGRKDSLGRKYFESANEMEEIYGKERSNVRPDIILYSDTQHTPNDRNNQCNEVSTSSEKYIENTHTID